MSEHQTPEEFVHPPHQLLELAREYGTPITPEMQQVMNEMRTNLTGQNYRELYTQLHLLIEQADLESPNSDQLSQVKRQISRMLITAHMMHTTNEQWGMVETELQDALTIADQTADAGHDEFIDIGDTINQLINDLAPKQS